MAFYVPVFTCLAAVTRQNLSTVDSALKRGHTKANFAEAEQPARHQTWTRMCDDVQKLFTVLHAKLFTIKSRSVYHGEQPADGRKLEMILWGNSAAL
jgi:hypothetical protein